MYRFVVDHNVFKSVSTQQTTELGAISHEVRFKHLVDYLKIVQ